jgi:hypothetical protein
MEYTTTLVNNHIVVLTFKDTEAEAQTVALTFQELSGRQSPSARVNITDEIRGRTNILRHIRLPQGVRIPLANDKHEASCHHIVRFTTLE